MKRRWERVIISNHAANEWNKCPYTKQMSRKRLARVIVDHMLPLMEQGIQFQNGAIHIPVTAAGGVTAVLVPDIEGWGCKTFYWKEKEWKIKRERERTG